MGVTLEQIETAVAHLQSLGVQAGQRIGIQAPASCSLVLTVLACWKLKAMVVPLSLRYSTPRVDQTLRAMQCDRLLREEDLPGVEDACFSGISWGPLALDISQEASILLTSGSMGLSKGVVHSLGNHLASAQGAEAQISFGADETWLVSLPMYHISGFALIMRALLHSGGLHFLRSGETLGEAVQKKDFTHLSVVPTQLRDLLGDSACHAGLQRLKAILVGGAHCPASLLDRGRDLGLNLYVSYGSTEMASQITTTLVNTEGHLGQVLPHRQLRVSDTSEIEVRGDTRFQGYWTEQGWERPFDEDGWFATGDLGHLDAQGYLHITGRKDTLFISGGENIYPEEIERALLQLEDVKQCVVVPIPSERFGQRPVAFIDTRDGTMPERQIWLEALAELESFKVPDTFLLWPKDLSEGVKVSREELAKRARGYS